MNINNGNYHQGDFAGILDHLRQVLDSSLVKKVPVAMATEGRYIGVLSAEDHLLFARPQEEGPDCTLLDPAEGSMESVVEVPRRDVIKRS